MKKIWSNDPEKIQEKIDYLCRNKIPIILAQKDKESQTAYLQEVKPGNAYTKIVFSKTKEIRYEKEPCFFLYRPLEYLTHIFEGVPLQDSEKNLTILRPPIIFEISKRKNPRVDTPNSRALYLLPLSTRLCKGKLKDISLEGAFMIGPYLSCLKKDLNLGPLDLTLETSSLTKPVDIHIPEATVIRIDKFEGNTAGIAIHFQLKDDNINKLKEYIELRTMELNNNS